MIVETDGLRALIAKSLTAIDTHRGELNRQGCVPPALNPRLAKQQGTLLLNCVYLHSPLCLS
jgi:hypothetical protein